ncbi:MAG: biotin/lipoyl-containing protein [Planctomycetota bacterium]|jgi:acetyl-CoA/propionyl-CoA carboxylase biotin carboxyl carrier protein|nr:biotin/lipoyl-containing protein [Planctomycetota bacterium]MDP6941872.1 biotin/lipoyl-containing protein [Planctomycetota bacterium]
MKYFVEGMDGYQVELNLEDLGSGRYEIKVNGKTIEADISSVDRLGQYTIGLDHETYAASIEQNGDPTDLHVGIAGGRWHFQVLDERERAASELSDAAGGKAESVKAQMPGLVVEINASVGDVLEPGGALLVLEAMKMQNEVVTEQGGRVCEISVEEGQAVESGAPMVRLEPVEE